MPLGWQVELWSDRVHLPQADDKILHQVGSGDLVYLLACEIHGALWKIV